MPIKRTTRKPIKKTPSTDEVVALKTRSNKILETRDKIQETRNKSMADAVPAIAVFSVVAEPILDQSVVNESVGMVVKDVHKIRRRVYLIVGILVLGLILASVLAVVEGRKIMKESSTPKAKTQKIVMDAFVPLDATSITPSDGRSLSRAQSGMPIDPSKSVVDFVVPSAKLTVKDSYDLAFPLAQSWSSDAKLELIKSVGTATGEGKAAQWQVIFGSAEKKAGYEVVIFADQVASQKQLDSPISGHELPARWFDSSGAVTSLATMPQFSKATISGINFYYSEDSKGWLYGLNTSNGVTGVTVN